MSDETYEELEILENDLEEYAPNKNFRSIRDDIIPDYFQPQVNYSTGLPFDMYKHQKQALAWSLQAEGEGPASDKDGNLFYSRSAINALGTGMGKTLVGLGVACFNVTPSKVPENYLSTSLNFVKLKQAKRENIDCTIIVAEGKIMNDAWLSDARKFYPNLPKYVYEGDAVFKRQFVETSPEVGEAQSNYYKHSDIIRQGDEYFKKSGDKDAVNRIYLSNGYNDFLDKDGNPRSYDFMARKLKTDFDNKMNEAFASALANVMKQVKVFFCQNIHFYTLFPFFKKYTVNRGIFDEPQNTVYTNQVEFRDYLPDEKLKELKMNGMGKMLPYYEESPFRFLWLYSATPHLIRDNDDKHYFNKWIAKNDYVLTDYIRSVTGRSLFPKLIEKYVIKFPYKYTIESRPGYDLLINRFNLKCRRSRKADVLRGALGDDIDAMLENDDFDGILRKLGGGSINEIFTLAVDKLRSDIDKRRQEISAYSAKTNQTIRDKSEAELQMMIRNLSSLQARISELSSGQSDVCSICLEDFDYETSDQKLLCCLHSDHGDISKCGGKFHYQCIVPSLKRRMKCPKCNLDIHNWQIDFTFIRNKSESKTDEVSNYPKFYNNIDYNYESKMDALKDALGLMKRKTPEGQEQYFYRNKVLLFVECKDDAKILTDIIKLCQDNGYNVRLPFTPSNVINQTTGKVTKAKDALKTAYPDVMNSFGRMEVTFPNASKAKIQEEINSFKMEQRRFVWIFRSGKESAGLNFPFVDTLIEYSRFKSHKQIIGRALRLNREVPVDLFRLFNVGEDESEDA